jgi:hypothetical protein
LCRISQCSQGKYSHVAITGIFPRRFKVNFAKVNIPQFGGTLALATNFRLGQKWQKITNGATYRTIEPRGSAVKFETQIKKIQGLIPS